jgi:hypothetical protein
LEDELRSKYGEKQVLSVLPGCPKVFTLHSGGKQYNVTPVDLAHADYCQLNVPFSVSARLTESEAMQVIKSDLQRDAVSLDAVYITEVPFVAAKMDLSFNKSRFFNALQSELRVRVPPYADADVQLAIQKVSQTLAMKVNVQGDLSPVMSDVIAQAKQLFFTPFVPDPNLKNKECNGMEIACFRLSYANSHDDENFSVHWSQTTNALTGSSYITWTRLKPLNERKQSVGRDESGAVVQDAKGAKLSNRGPALTTGLTVMPGDQVTIEPVLFFKDGRDTDPGTSTHQARVECDHFERRCHMDSVKPDAFSSTNMCPVSEGIQKTKSFDSGSINSACVRMFCRDECAQFVDHGTTTTSFNGGNPKRTTLANPAGQIQKLYEQLSLSFTWRDIHGNEHTRECPLLAFGGNQGNGNNYKATIENNPESCDIFPADQASFPILSLVNHIKVQETYVQGTLIQDWLGRTLSDTRTQRTYEPEISLYATVSIPDYDFLGSLTSGVQRR